MGSVFVHIAHDTGSVDLAVPDDEPVDILLPRLLAAAGVPWGDCAWTLSTPGGAPLPGRGTLRSASVVTGSTLRLMPAEEGGDAEPAEEGGAAGPVEGEDDEPKEAVFRPASLGIPALRTSAALPQRVSLPGRIAAAASALVDSSPNPGVALDAGLGSGPTPAALTRRPPMGPVERIRSGWAATDYVGALDRIIAEPRLTRCATIAVMSPKGGVGKTTITALLGTLLALLRRDRIVAIDTNPDYGSLGRTLAPSHNVFVDDLLEVLDHPVLTVTQLDTSLARAQHGLLVLPAPTAPERMARLDQEAYTRVIRKLQHMVSVIVLDCGTGLWEPAARAALGAADQVVLVSDAEPATASLVAEASLQLRNAQVPVTLVVNKMSAAGQLDVERFARSIDWAQGLVTVADERRAAASIATDDFDWHRAPRSWRIATRELAAVIALDWVRLGLTL